MNYLTEGTKISIKVNGDVVEGIIGGYNYGLSGRVTSFYFEGQENIRRDLELLDPEWCTILAAPVIYHEEDEKLDYENV